MTDARRAWDDAALEAGLRGLGDAIAWPSPVAAPAGPDLAARVRDRIVAEDLHPAVSRTGFGLALPRWRAGRLALVLALVALLAVAALAGAAALGLPGLRITLGEPSGPAPTIAPSAGAPVTPRQAAGGTMGLGTALTLDEAAAAIGGPLPLPDHPTLGPPDAAYVDRTRANQVALVWAADDDTPETLADGVGLVVMAFDGRVGEREMTEKIVGSGSTLEPVTVNGHPGFWIEGDPHIFFYRTRSGEFIDDARRWVGDALIWSDGSTTYRIESALGRDATIRIAESIE